MIRIYLDWSVISSLKTESGKELKDLLSLYKDDIIIPYTPAHFDDLMRSYKEDNEFFEQDICLLENLTDNNFLEYTNKKGISILNLQPREYFEYRKNIKQEELLELSLNFDKLKEDFIDEPLYYKLFELLEDILKLVPINKDNEIFKKLVPDSININSFYDLFSNIDYFVDNFTNNGDFYKKYRRLTNEDFKLESNSGNWQPKDVFININNHLLKRINQDFDQFTKLPITKDKENLFIKHISYYCNLDIVGYQEDKLPKSNNSYKNILTDAAHSFYAGYCDYFIVNDKVLSKRTKAMYSNWGVNTRVLNTQEFIAEIRPILEQRQNDIAIQARQLFLNQKDKTLEYSEESNSYIFTIELENKYLGYFNIMSFEYHKSKDLINIFFLKYDDNYSNFMFYSEIDYMIGKILNYIGLNSNNDEFSLITKRIKNLDENLLILQDSFNPTINIIKNKISPHYILNYVFQNINSY